LKSPVLRCDGQKTTWREFGCFAAFPVTVIFVECDKSATLARSIFVIDESVSVHAPRHVAVARASSLPQETARFRAQNRPNERDFLRQTSGRLAFN